MRLRLNRKLVPWLAAVLLVSGSFASGFIACLHSKTIAPSGVRSGYLRQVGDAPPAVRAGVLAALNDFQAGYKKRDPKDLDAFMNRLFERDGDVLIEGTDAGEWVRGFPAASEFIGADWRDWGDFRFNADDAIVWSTGDVAWIASIGEVHFKGTDRPIRFSAVLTRKADRWLFRQVHFQWDERDPGSGDILRPGTYLQLVKLAISRMAQTAH